MNEPAEDCARLIVQWIEKLWRLYTIWRSSPLRVHTETPRRAPSRTLSWSRPISSATRCASCRGRSQGSERRFSLFLEQTKWKKRGQRLSKSRWLGEWGKRERIQGILSGSQRTATHGRWAPSPASTGLLRLLVTTLPGSDTAPGQWRSASLSISPADVYRWNSKKIRQFVEWTKFVETRGNPPIPTRAGHPCTFDHGH